MNFFFNDETGHSKPATLAAYLTLFTLAITQLVFIFLKVFGVVNWYWIIVFLPIILSTSFPLLAFAVFTIIDKIIQHRGK